MAYRNTHDFSRSHGGDRKGIRSVESLEDVRQHIELSDELTASRKRDLKSALSTFSRAARRELSDLPCEIRLVRVALEQIAPARFNISRRRWANVRSLVFKAIELASSKKRQASSFAPPSDSWTTLLQPLPRKEFQIPLRSFARWCTSQDIEPFAVKQHDFERYGRYLEEESARSRPRGTYCAVVRTWNRAGDRLSDWPKLRVVLDSRKRTYALPLSHFPASFERDVNAMIDHATGKCRTSQRPRKTIRQVSARSRIALIREFATGLIHSGWKPESIKRIADLVTVEAADAGLEYQIQRQGGKYTVHVFQHAKLLGTLARRWVGADATTLSTLSEICRNIRQELDELQSMTVKNRDTLRHFEDPRMVEKFLLLPERIARKYGPTASSKQSSAVKVQIALAVLLLTHAPVRCRNLHSIRLGINLIDRGQGRERRLHLYFAKKEVKNSVELEFPLSSDAIKLLDHYIKDVRPKLLRERSDYLFPGLGDGPKGAALLSEQIANTVQDMIGVRLTVHQFRHLIGFLYLQENPSGHEVVRQLLGHKDIQTTLRFYAGMERDRAIAHVDNFLNEQKARHTNIKMPKPKRGTK